MEKYFVDISSYLQASFVLNMSVLLYCMYVIFLTKHFECCSCCLQFTLSVSSRVLSTKLLLHFFSMMTRKLVS